MQFLGKLRGFHGKSDSKSEYIRVVYSSIIFLLCQIPNPTAT